MIAIVGRSSSPIARATKDVLGVTAYFTEMTDPIPQLSLEGLVYLVGSKSNLMTDQLNASCMGLMHVLQNEPVKPNCGIVVVNSAFAGRKHTGDYLAYNAGKAAQRQLVLNMSVHIGAANRWIVGLAPAFVNTHPHKRMNTDNDYRTDVQDKMSVNTFMNPQDVAVQIKHFLRHGRYFNGLTIDMSGGWSL